MATRSDDHVGTAMCKCERSQTASAKSASDQQAADGSVKQIKGFWYDSASKRYFKLPPGGRGPPALQQRNAEASTPVHMLPAVLKASGLSPVQLSKCPTCLKYKTKKLQTLQPLRSFSFPSLLSTRQLLGPRTLQSVLNQQAQRRWRIVQTSGIQQLEGGGREETLAEQVLLHENGSESFLVALAFTHLRIHLSDKMIIKPLSAEAYPVSARICPRGELIFVVDLGGALHRGGLEFYHPGAGGEPHNTTYRCRGHASAWCAEWSPQRTHIALGLTKKGELLDVATLRPVCTLKTTKSDVFCQAFMQDGRVVLSGTRSGVLYVHDTRCRGVAPTALQSDRFCSGLTSVCALNTPYECLSVSLDGKLFMWDLRVGRPAKEFHGFQTNHTLAPTLWMPRLCVSPSQDTIFLGGAGNYVHVWDVQSACMMNAISGYPATASVLAYTRDQAVLSLFDLPTRHLHCPVLLSSFAGTVVAASI